MLTILYLGRVGRQERAPDGINLDSWRHVPNLVERNSEISQVCR